MCPKEWKANLLQRESQDLLPKHLPIEVLTSIAERIAVYRVGGLARKEMLEITDFLTFWVEKLVNAQGPHRVQLYQEYKDELLPNFAKELYLWVRFEIRSRRIDYPTAGLTVTNVFQMHFEDVGNW